MTVLLSDRLQGLTPALGYPCLFYEALDYQHDASRSTGGRDGRMVVTPSAVSLGYDNYFVTNPHGHIQQ